MSKYTAKEILAIAGVEKPEDVVGKMRVRIGGISVRELDKIVNVKGESVDVLIGTETATVTVPERPETEVSDDLESARKVRGEKSTKAFNASQIAKGRMEKEDKA